MRNGLIITYDADGKPTLEFAGLYTEMAKRFAEIKAGAWPDKAVKAEPWDSLGGRAISAVKITKPNPIQKTMKTLKSVLPLLAFFAFASGASAQLQTIGFPTTFNIVATGESNLATPYVLDVRGQKDVAIKVKYNLTGAGTDAVNFRFYPSVDGTTAAGVQILDTVKAANGATAVTISTNITVSGYPYLLLTRITNGASLGLTNISVQYFIKKNAP